MATAQQHRDPGSKVADAAREPLRGQELLNFVADLVLRGFTPTSIARKASIPIAHATRLKHEIFERIYASAAETYTPDGLKRLKHELSETLRQIIDDAKDAVEATRGTEDFNTRPHNQSLSAIKQLAAMHGFNAPVKVESTDLRLYAAVRPDQMDRVLSDPAARRAMLEFEEAVAGLNLAADEAREPVPPAVLALIDVDGEELPDPADEIDDTADPWDGIDAEEGGDE